MSGRFSLEDFGQTIGLEGAVFYLESRGWKSRRKEDRGQIWFESPPSGREDSIQLYLPISEEYADYPARLEELVKAVSIFEERLAIEIVTEMARATGYGGTSHRTGSASTLQEIIADELPRMKDTISAEEASELMKRLPSLERGAELITDGLSEFPAIPNTVVQGTALVATSLAKILPASGEWKFFLWRVCARLMRQIDVELRWMPSQLDEFFDLARSANRDLPESLFEWLFENATPTPRRGRRKTLEKKE